MTVLIRFLIEIQKDTIPYESRILGQLLDLESPAKINISEPRFESYTKIKIKNFECPKSIKSIKENNTWNIRLLVDDLFVPSSKQPSVIYCRLTDFKLRQTSETEINKPYQ